MVLPAQVAPLDWSPELLQAMAASVEASPWGGLSNPLEALRGSFLFQYRSGGQRALFALRPLDFQAGQRLDVVGLVSLGDRLQAQEFDKAMTGTARAFGARVLAMTTARPHVARQCERTGWQQSGVVMTKELPNV